MMRRFPGLGLLLFCGACGGPQPDAPINAPIGIASVAPPPATTAPSQVTTVPDQPTHGPSRELVRRFPMKDKTVVLVYADLGGFASTDLGRATAKAMTSAFKSESMKKCFVGALGLKELAFGIDDSGGLIVARFDKDPTADLETCIDAVDSDYVQQKGAGGKKSWGRGGSEGLYVDGNYVIFGTTNLVESALASNAPDEGQLASLRLAADQFLYWQGHERGFETHGSLTANKQRVFVDGQIEFTDEEDAKNVEQRESPGKLANEIGRKLEKIDKGAWTVLNKIAGDVKMRREDKHVSITFELNGSPEDQSKDIGALAALGVRGFEYEMGRSRTYAASSGIYQIQSSLQSWASATNPRPKKLVSLPAVPKAIPKGTKTKLTKADWKAWSAIHYEQEGATRYQFEVKASKTGDTAEILARGDLDGNGKSSLYKMEVRLNASGDLEMVSGIAETDPQE